MRGQLNVDKAAVRHFLMGKQFLHAQEERVKKLLRAEDVMNMISQLECVQLDPVAAVERNQHLVLASRIPGYKPELLEQLLEEGQVFEYWANAACVIPMQDFPIFEVTRRRRQEQIAPLLDKLGPVVKEVTERLEMEGPLPSKAFESSRRVRGYWDNDDPKTKATSHALNLLCDAGLIQVVRRAGTTRYFDLPQRAVPSDLLDTARQMSDVEAASALLFKYLRAYRVFDPTDFRFGWGRMSAKERQNTIVNHIKSGVVTPLQIEGVKKSYYILSEDEEDLRANAFAGPDKTSHDSRSITFLPPLDNLLWRRERIMDLFDFEYKWEVYIPASKRRFGYYSMPILAGEQFIGRMDPRLDRDRGILNIELLQIEPHVRWTKSLQNRVMRAVDKFARFHNAQVGNIIRCDPGELLI